MNDIFKLLDEIIAFNFIEQDLAKHIGEWRIGLPMEFFKEFEKRFLTLPPNNQRIYYRGILIHPIDRT